MSRSGADRRRGVLLLVVLALLVLLTTLLASFIPVTTKFRSATSGIGRHPPVGTNARSELDMAMYQLVRGTRNPQSSLLGHDLLSDLYGFDGFQGRIASATVPGGMGGRIIDLTVDRTAPVTDVLGDPITLDAGSGYYSGCVLTVVFDAAHCVSTRIVDYDGHGKVFRVLAMGLQRQDSPALAQLGGAKFVVNGRPFNGTGAGWNAATGTRDAPKLDALEDDWPMALLPNRAPAAQGGVPWSSYVQGGPDESYDAPDFQNVFLALSTTSPSETIPDSIVNPSFHRRALVNYWLKQTGGDLPDDLLRRIVLRTNAKDP